MNITIFHRIPFAKIRYDKVIDHAIHDITYLCLSGSHEDIPASLRARRLILGSPGFYTDYIRRHHADSLQRCDRLIARSEHDLLTAAVLREEFGIAGDKPKDVLPIRDKWLMRSLAETAGIRQPRFWSIPEFLADPEIRSGQYLIKPRCEASSNGIVLGPRARIMALAQERKHTEEEFIEQYIPGKIVHVDGYVADGEIITAVASEYVGTCLDFARGQPLGSCQTHGSPALWEAVKACLSALAYRNGSFHYEGIQDDLGTHYFLEVAGRVGGAGVAETFQEKTGINLYHADLKYQVLARHPELEKARNNNWFGWFVFPGHPYSGEIEVRFDTGKWRKYMVACQVNSSISTSGSGYSYAASTSPISGIIRGDQHELLEIMGNLLEDIQILESRQ